MNPFDRPIPADCEVYTVEVNSYRMSVVAVVAKSPEQAEKLVREGRGITLSILCEQTEYEVMDGQGNCRLKGIDSEEA